MKLLLDQSFLSYVLYDLKNKDNYHLYYVQATF